MTNEELDKARAREAWRVYDGGNVERLAAIAARLAREGWTPPEPVDPDVLAFEKWDTTHEYGVTPTIKGAFIAGLELAREQEQERAKGLVEALTLICKYSRNFGNLAGPVLAAYKAGKAAR
jgi:hypothetical protein